MHLSSSSPHFLSVFTCKVVCFFTISVISLGITSADKLTSPFSPASPPHKARNQWSLKHSSPTRDGKFLNVPVYYGDWVPINSAKAQIESLASSVDVVPSNNRRKDEFVPTLAPIFTTDDLTSPVKSSFVVSDHLTHNTNQHTHFHPHSQPHEAEERVDIDHHVPPSFIGPRLPTQEFRELRDSAVRYNTVNRPLTRGRNQYRGGNAVVGNSRRKHRPTNSDALTRLFGPSFSWNGNRRQHRKIAQPPHPQNSLLGSIFGPSPSPSQHPSLPQTTTSTGSVALDTLGTIGNHWPAFPNIRDSSKSEDPYVPQEASESVFQPFVKLLPSPNLTQDDKSTNNLIYEDDGNGEGDIIVGRRPGQNEIDGFIPVSSGHVIRPENHGHHSHRHPSNFSVLISGINQNIDESSLARLFKEGKIAEDGEHSAFIGSPDANAPDGFHKINLPFMNPSHTSSDPAQLPSIFIAPLGYKAPKGYKGHPLPFDPAPTNALYGTKGKTVVHTTEPSSEVNDIIEDENEVKPKKFKNPFLRNKLRSQRFPYKPIKTTSTTDESILPDVSIKSSTSTEKSDISAGYQNEASDSTNYVRSKIKFTRNRFKPQRKRVLTKIVRKPYNPSITTPSPTLETKKIVRIVDPTSVSLKVEEYFPPTSGRPILGGRKADDKIDLVVDQEYNVTKIKPSLGISTTFRPIQIKYIDLDLEPTKKAIAINEPKSTEPTSDATSKQTDWKKAEADIKVVDHFEPTTTHNNLVFETTQYDEQTTYKGIESEPEESYEEKEETTVPTSFVTRHTFTPVVTTYKPSTKIIQFLPYSPAATTRSTTTTTITQKKTTTSNAVTESNQSYEPTPFNFNLDPIARLEKLNRLKNKKYVGKNNWSSNIDKEEANDYVIPTVRPTKSTHRNEKGPYKVHSSRIKYRKYGYNQGKDDGRIFGQRIKERKRPKLWDNGYVRDNLYATTTEGIETSTTKKSKTEEYKRKFRPFFDQLYERLTNEKDKDTENPSGNNRRISVFSVRRKIRPYKGWRKKSRSTTTPNPFTINAEIYEVHPESRARITTTTSAAPPPTFEVVTESSTFYQDYDNEVEEETPKSTIFGEKIDDSTNPLDQSKDIEDRTEFYQSDVHETADKHTPVHHDYDLDDTAYDKKDTQSSSILIPFKSSVQETNELSHNGLVDSNVALDFGESQFLEDSLNEVKVEAPKSSVPPATRLLDQYQKTFAPSNQLANKHDADYQEPKGIINEHSQQKLTVKEGDFIPFHDVRTGDHWEPRPLVPYVEIDRINPKEKAPLSISVETVPTDDTSLIQEVLEEYNISGPVDAGSSQQKEISDQNEIDDQPLPDYTNDFIENSQNAEATTTKDVSENEETTSTIVIHSDENISEEINTTQQGIDIKKNEEEQTTISFFVTPTTQNTNTVHDKLLSDPLPTIHENTLILENANSEESTTSVLSNGSSDDLSKETTSTKLGTTLEEEAVPEVVEEKSTVDSNSTTSDQDTTEFITTVSPTTLLDNFEVTTFRPKGNGGFFENFNLANLLSYIVPKRSTSGTTKVTTVENPTPTTTQEITEEESKLVTETPTTTIEDETAKTTFYQKKTYTTVDKSEDDPLPTHLPSTISSKNSDEITTTIQNVVHNKAITSSNTESLPSETTKTPGTSIPVRTIIPVQPTVYIAPSPAETTYKEKEIDTTTKSDIVFETTTEPKPEETSTETFENENDQTTTESNYISTTFSNRIRTDRPFRGPFRIQKTYKKGGSRYQLKNKTKKFGSGLKKKLDDKNKTDSTISKAVYGAIKREEYIKNWVARKYNKLENNSKKRLFQLQTTLQPQTTVEPSEETTAESEATTTTEAHTSSVETLTSTTKNAALPFAPTILPPKNKFFNVDLDVTIRDGSRSSSVTKASSLNTVASAKKFISEKRKTFLDKLKSTARKNLSDNLFAKNIKNGSKSSETSSSSISKPAQKSSKKISWVYPRGSDTKVFKKWGGNSLSQAEFERKVLGVSTATEVSVKSMICVRGRCYNADDKSLAKN